MLTSGLVTSSTTLALVANIHMNDRDHLRRLPREYYLADAIVHWTITMRDRKQGWLSVPFLYRFRELLTHTMFRYGLACPIFCLMPDHLHMVWMGLCQGSDQLNAMKHLRTTCNESLERIGFELQDQAFDHVFTGGERREDELRNTCEYIARNAERAGLVGPDEYASYGFNGCLVAGYPELRPFEDGYWDQFDKITSFLRETELYEARTVVDEATSPFPRGTRSLVHYGRQTLTPR